MPMATFNCLSVDVDVYLRISFMLHADDTVLLAESHNELQKELNGRFEFCKMRDLHINKAKTTVEVFRKSKLFNILNLFYENKY